MSEIESQPQVEFKEPEPLLKTRAFEILALSTQPEGITFITGQTLPRPPRMKERLLEQGEYGTNILNNIKKDLIQREVPSSLRDAVAQGSDKKQLEAQIAIWKELGVEISEEQIEAYMNVLPAKKAQDHVLLSGEDRSRYVRQMESNNKFRLSNVAVSVDGNTIIADVNKCPFIAYKHIRRPEDVARGLIEYAYPTGVCNVLETTEPEGGPHNYFVLGRRYEENNQYRASKASGGQPGALGAGLMDSTFSPHTSPGHPETLTNQKIFNQGGKELMEEAGFSQQTRNASLDRITNNDIKDYATGKIHEEAGPVQTDIERMKIVCFGRDLVAPHQEIGLSAVSSKSLGELLKIHQDMSRVEDEKNFSEGIFSIPANPDAVEKFITQCRILMPPTHYMPLIAASYEKLATFNGGGPEAKRVADEWKERVERGCDILWQEVDQMVERYYLDNPQAVEDNKLESRRDSINVHGFDPAVLADRQIMEKMPDGSYQPVTLNGELERLGFAQN